MFLRACLFAALLTATLPHALRAGSTRTDYRIRPGDQLGIMVPLNLELNVVKNLPFAQSSFMIFGNEIFSRDVLVVDPYGMLDLPLIGTIPAAGQTPQEIGETISAGLRTFIPDGRCTVTLLQAAPLYINIFGEVSRPNRYEIKREVTIYEAIALAGGFTPFANKKSVKLIRQVDGQYRVTTINLAKALKKEVLEENIILRSDDIVVVEENLL